MLRKTLIKKQKGLPGRESNRTKHPHLIERQVGIKLGFSTLLCKKAEATLSLGPCLRADITSPSSVRDWA